MNAKADTQKVKLLYHGFDPQKFQRNKGVEKDKIVLTVSEVSYETSRIKQLELFVQSATYLPDVQFALVGPWLDDTIAKLKAIALPNITFIGGLYEEDLIRMFNRVKVYVQVSARESFGCSLAEAMLCECVPVVSRHGAIPEVVGDCGIYVDELTPAQVATAINKALAKPEWDR